ncbi:MAG: PQQ-like beta-propeller repeat protein [Rhodobacteraceae bacterium]|nr:PQQ-like beta-propeller repeat protein [Paracoccaceae bacterium]
MTASPLFQRTGLAVLGLSLLMLAACEEPEVILTGPREDIRADAEPLAAAPVAPGPRTIALPATVANAEWAQSHGTQAFRVANAALGPAPQRIWSVSIGEGDSRKLRITADPVVGAGRVYTLDAGALVTATGTGGAPIWSRDLTPPRDDRGDATGGGLAYADGTLYVSLGFGELLALDAATGAERWRQQLDATGSGAPTVAGDLVYLVAGDDTGWAVRRDNGRIAWQVLATPSVANILGAPAPALTDSLTVFAFGSGDLVSTFRNGGLRRWSASVAGQRLGRSSSKISDITGAPVVAGRTLFAGNHSGRIAAFDVDSGDRLWTAREGVFGPVWPVGGSVFAITDRNQLVRLDAGSGVLVWAVDLPGFLRDKPRRRAAVHAHHGPVLAGGRLVVTSSDGLIRFFAPDSGALVGTAEVPGGATTAPAVAGGTLYVVGANGQLHAFR